MYGIIKGVGCGGYLDINNFRFYGFWCGILHNV
mgnify:CR=1 FL=1